MLIYLGGSCSPDARPMMEEIAAALRKMEYEVYCPFELKIPNAWDYTQEVWADKVFRADLKKMDKCDLFLMVSSGRMSSAGTNWEQGYIYALGIPIIVLQFTDEPTSLMTYCSADTFINTTKSAIAADAVRAVQLFSLLNENFKSTCKTTLT